MNYFWVTFKDGKRGTIEAKAEVFALRKAEEMNGKNCLVSLDMIPYPASPVLHQEPDQPYGPCPPFCYSPEQCKGRTSCPKMRACSE